MSVDELKKIVEDFRSKVNSGVKTTDAEWSKFGDAFRELNTNSAVGDDYISDVTDWTKEFTAANPQYVAETLKDKKTKSFISDVISTALTTADLMTSRAQIKAGQAAQKNSKQPVEPSKYKLDENVSRSIRDTLQSMSPTGVEQQLAPYKQDIIDSYSADINNAETASGGQAGSFGSYGQAAVNRRLRSAGDLSSKRLEINDALRRNLNYALQNRLSERQIEQSRNMNVYSTKLAQYNSEQQAAGALEQQGRINQRASIYGLANNIAPFINRAVDANDSSANNAKGNIFQRLFKNPGIQDPGVLNKPGGAELIDWKADYNQEQGNTSNSYLSMNYYNDKLDSDMLKHKLNLG